MTNEKFNTSFKTKEMKTKTAYYVTAIERDENGNTQDRSQYLLPNEIHLIKTMLNNGLKILGVRKDELSEKMFKVYFS